MIDYPTTDWLNALGWTFIHTLWQAPLLLLAVVVCLRLMTSRNARARYAIACGGFLLLVLSSVLTYFFILSRPTSPGMTSAHQTEAPFIANPSPASFPAGPELRSTIDVVLDAALTIEEYMPWILSLWVAGFLLFSIRLSMAFLYTWRIRSAALVVENDWNDFIANAGKALGIDQLVSLAESPSVSAPVVLGYFKPIIVIPIGMLTGLTTDQLETIFLHELAHIRRHDFLINFLQSVVEAVFFFNPFVWVLSSIIRREREYCCDDIVVQYHGGKRAYAHALARLAEARLAFPGFALSLASDKNQLLNRIKRIMERSVKNSGRGRFAIPAILLLGALMCISWLGMDKAEPEVQQEGAVSSSDTVPDVKKGTATYSRKSIITLDEKGQPHEEVIEEFEGDESLRPLLEKKFDRFGDNGMAGFPGPHFFAPHGFGDDTIPPALDFWRGRDWEAQLRTLQENLQKFEMFQPFADDSLFMKGFADRWETFDIPDEALKAFEQFSQADSFRLNAFEQMEDELKRLQELGLDHRLRDFEKEFAPFTDHSSGYESALRDQLLRDGYLKKDESIESLEWSNDSFKVNGKSIRKEDREKYQKLNSKFFGGNE